MARRRASPPPKLVWLVLCLAVGLTAGCARPTAVHHSEPATNSPATEQNLPFHQNPEHASDESPHPAVPVDRKSGSGTPFPAASHAHSLPAGTLLTVRLDKSLSIPQVRPGDTFTASVAGPLTLDGDILVETWYSGQRTRRVRPTLRGPARIEPRSRLRPPHFDRHHRRWQSARSSDFKPVREGNLSGGLTIEFVLPCHRIRRAISRTRNTERTPPDFPAHRPPHLRRSQLGG